MIETILKMCNFDVIKAQNGFEALQLGKKAFRYQEENIDEILQ
jgi:hypothetical protein